MAVNDKCRANTLVETGLENQVSVRPMAELAAQYGTTERTLRRWRASGVDIQDAAAVEAYKATLQDRKGDGGDASELRQKKLEAEARLKHAQADKAELALAQARGELVSIPALEETLLFLANRTKGQLARLEKELPPRLEGLAAAAMIPIVREFVSAVLTDLANDFDSMAGVDAAETNSGLREGDTSPGGHSD